MPVAVGERRDARSFRGTAEAGRRKRSEALLDTPTAEEARRDSVKPVQVEYQTKTQLLQDLNDHSSETVDVHIGDVVDMVASLRSVDRTSMMQTAIAAWVYQSFGYAVLEVECHEQPRSEDSTTSLLLFRARLDGDYELELSRLKEGEQLEQKLQKGLVAALPGDLVARQHGDKHALEQMVHITWVKGGSIELGGVASLGLVVMIVMAIGIGMCRWDLCHSLSFLSCSCCIGTRPGRAEADEYSAAIKELRERGAEFEVSPDGSAKLRVPPRASLAAPVRCPECAIM
eukprot:TRINITY_DN33899_c0_g1_i1.p1 TRINITY_DN33899_c0_g1~~TRINITY_DN33899_c0_g1_i1.p1  ORF type:complete len:315 (-),score=43.13 TRINITY_DN33899_c0_g1_i1:114-974(-)